MTACALVAPARACRRRRTMQTVSKRLDAASIARPRQPLRLSRAVLHTPDISESQRRHPPRRTCAEQLSSRVRRVLRGTAFCPVDDGTRALAGSHGEAITEGLDGLNDRLAEYRELGARFAKWRAVFVVSGTLPSAACTHANAHALARFAAMCQEQRLVPIVEPEVLREGAHSIERCEDVTGQVLHAVFDALHDQGVYLEAMLLMPNMVTAGSEYAMRPTIEDVATATVRCFRRHVPAAVPGVVFLSGGQDHLAATTYLNAINRLTTPKPWTLTLPHGTRAPERGASRSGEASAHLKAAQAAAHRSRCCSAAAGRYTSARTRTRYRVDARDRAQRGSSSLKFRCSATGIRRGCPRPDDGSPTQPQFPARTPTKLVGAKMGSAAPASTSGRRRVPARLGTRRVVGDRRIAAVGHRVVGGGTAHDGPCLIDAAILA
jgi:fructose-bisphosphate aldolase class I